MGQPPAKACSTANHHRTRGALGGGSPASNIGKNLRELYN